ncbi:MAG: hypothetical protein HWE24_07370 [Oceanospirillaceae bacterium]|nr:hypothetical protein [Oceanospirillaceae bacterium]
MKKYGSIALNGIFILTILLFVLDTQTPIDIKSQPIKSFTYYGFLVLTPIVLFWNLWVFKSLKSKLLGSALPVLAAVWIYIIGPMKIVFSSSAWRTQKVIYQNEHLSSKKIEFQMQDVGAFGYNRRTVEVTYLTDLFMIVRPAEIDVDENDDWVRIDQEVNELELKFP